MGLLEHLSTFNLKKIKYRFKHVRYVFFLAVIVKCFKILTYKTFVLFHIFTLLGFHGMHFYNSLTVISINKSFHRSSTDFFQISVFKV